MTDNQNRQNELHDDYSIWERKNALGVITYGFVNDTKQKVVALSTTKHDTEFILALLLTARKVPHDQNPIY